MRKFNSAVIVIGIILALSGCGNDQYAIEKEYWKAQKIAERIFKNPTSVPPKQLDIAVKALGDFIQKNPGSDLSVTAEFKIAQLYMVKEEYDKARQQYNNILTKYKKSAPVSSEAVFLTGNSYEKEDKWDMALSQYKLIMKDYPLTSRGFDIPLYIARHYNEKHQPEKMTEAIQHAIFYYKALAEKYPDSQVSFNAHLLVAQCYLALKDRQNAVSSLNLILEKYKGKAQLDGVLMSLSIIYMEDLKQKDKAVATLKELLKDYPKSKLAATAKEILEKGKKNE